MKRIWLAAVAGVLVLAVAVGVFLGVRTARNEQPVLVCGEYELTNTELAYYYWSEYFYFSEAYGDYLDGVVDFTKPLADQPYDNQHSWETYLLEETLSTVRDTMAMVFRAEEEGFTLPADYDATRQQVLLNFSVAAQEGGYGSTEAYLQASYGKTATEETFRAYLHNAHLAAAYADDLLARSVPTDEETRAFFARRQSAYEELYEIDPEDETTWLELARQDLQQENYQNAFLTICSDYEFLVNYDAVRLTPPKGLYE